jgi:hypothetical protein
MGARRRRIYIAALGAALFVGSCAVVQLLVSRGAIAPADAHDAVVGVDIEVPEVPGKKDPKKACHGCSIGKHHIPPYTDEVFREAMDGYAKEPYWQQSDGIDTLLFYGDETLEKLEQFGTEPLSPEHLAFLRRELSRTHAVVHIRVVDERGEVRVEYGPERVPLKVKEHLEAKDNGNLYAMEFNGTVARTGLYHLWSRY